ncbi:uncharacterized protein BYT42DRAFT_574953 [Radiomyces spectabilis]|uniref:uncharacterized protein n=1 Tax=Radiomyces spectabilis TaxID=64574 RepID=UPI00221E8548|nr:uncharacterized protein BYT42DRAFT_574953 [Radiomyces spectabilis]KAI8376531.1 hypothetical protein BYT42DRAFT_574953 [Radiomyces spectabilis]
MKISLLIFAFFLAQNQVRAQCACKPEDTVCLNTCVESTQSCMKGCSDNDCYQNCISDHWPGAPDRSASRAVETASNSVSALATEAASTSSTAIDDVASSTKVPSATGSASVQTAASAASAVSGGLPSMNTGASSSAVQTVSAASSASISAAVSSNLVKPSSASLSMPSSRPIVSPASTLRPTMGAIPISNQGYHATPMVTTLLGLAFISILLAQ